MPSPNRTHIRSVVALYVTPSLLMIIGTLAMMQLNSIIRSTEVLTSAQQETAIQLATIKTQLENIQAQNTDTSKRVKELTKSYSDLEHRVTVLESKIKL